MIFLGSFAAFLKKISQIFNKTIKKLKLSITPSSTKETVNYEYYVLEKTKLNCFLFTK